jgi:hypothetical protein
VQRTGHVKSEGSPMEDSASPPRPPGSPDVDSHQTQPWVGLFREGQAVGFARQSSATRLYSSDGYGWSGTPILSDYEARQVPFRLGSARIFHGDLVRIPPHSGGQSMVERIVCLTPRGRVVLIDPDSERADYLHDLWPPPSTARVHERLGSVLNNAQLRRRLSREARGAETGGVHRRWRALAVTGSIAFGLSLTSALQWALVGHVGPVSAMLGGLLGSLGFWVSLRRWCWSALRRRQLIRLGLESGLWLGSLGLLLSWAGVWSPAAERSALEGAATLTAHGLLGFLLGIICTVLGGDLVAWRTGGYAGEGAEPQGFRHSS